MDEILKSLESDLAGEDVGFLTKLTDTVGFTDSKKEREFKIKMYAKVGSTLDNLNLSLQFFREHGATRVCIITWRMAAAPHWLNDSVARERERIKSMEAERDECERQLSETQDPGKEQRLSLLRRISELEVGLVRETSLARERVSRVECIKLAPSTSAATVGLSAARHRAAELLFRKYDYESTNILDKVSVFCSLNLE